LAASLQKPTSEPIPVLVATGISKRFGPTTVLRRAALELKAGAVHILLGENGAGKSTLGKIISGLLAPDEGEIIIDGNPRRGHTIAAARAAGVEIVLQELSLVPQLSVEANLFLGHEGVRTTLAPISRRAEAREAEFLLRRFGLTCCPRTLVAQLPMAERQLVEIAKAARGRPRLIVMDEPSSRLTQREKAALFDSVRSLKESGAAVLYVTHHLNEVAEIGDQVSAMRGGHIVETVDVTDALSQRELIRMLTGRDIVTMYPRLPLRTAEPLLEVNGLDTGKLCRDVSLTVNRGEIVGLYGVVGCGRDEIARVLVGAARRQGGQITLAGRDYRPASPAAASAAAVTYIPPDRKENGAFAPLDLVANLTLNNLVHYAKFGVIERGRERREAQHTLNHLTVRFASVRQAISELSGGNQQKVLFGRSIDRKPQLVVMEDPTAGIDAAAKQELYRLFEDLSRDGISALLLSSDLDETIAICHRVYTFFNGHVIATYRDPTPDDRHAMLADVLGQTRQGAGNAAYA
jgi:ribose transport system ATP-binding protein